MSSQDLAKNLKLPRKMSRKESLVWKAFEEYDKKATCRICGKSIAHSGTTTNLWSHLSAKHYINKDNIEASSLTKKTNEEEEVAPDVEVKLRCLFCFIFYYFE